MIAATTDDVRLQECAHAASVPAVMFQNPTTQVTHTAHPHCTQAKIDGLPSALDLSPRRTRDMLTGCPDLLRRSTRALQERYQVGGGTSGAETGGGVLPVIWWCCGAVRVGFYVCSLLHNGNMDRRLVKFVVCVLKQRIYVAL